jgi:hypothetical protein
MGHSPHLASGHIVTSRPLKFQDVEHRKNAQYLEDPIGLRSCVAPLARMRRPTVYRGVETARETGDPQMLFCVIMGLQRE